MLHIQNPQYFLYRLLLNSIFCLSLGLPCAGYADKRYTISTDGQEVQDNQTGLIWRRCVEGMNWDGQQNTCDGRESTYTHEQAFQRATSEANRTGVVWRLPNIEELFSIVDVNHYNPCVDVSAFPGTPPRSTWSSTPYTTFQGQAWNVLFYFGDVEYGARSSPQVVRLVRDGI